MVRTLNSGLRAKGPRRYTPRTKSESITVPAGDLESRLAWISEAEELSVRQARADEIWNHEQAAGGDDLEGLGAKLRHAVYDQVVPQAPVVETLETPGASGEADTTDLQDVAETTGVPSDDPIDSEIKDGVIQPLPGADLDEQLEEKVEPEPETVPDGVTTIDALLEWVKAGDAPARAQIVLDQENTKPEDKRRKGLISKLTDIILED